MSEQYAQCVPEKHGIVSEKDADRANKGSIVNSQPSTGTLPVSGMDSVRIRSLTE